MPSGDFSRPHRTVDKSPAKRKTVTPAPVTDVQSGRAGHPYAHPAAPPPPPTWTNPVSPVRIAPPKRAAPKIPQVGPTIPQLTRREHKQAMRKRAQQVHAAARRDVLNILGAGPRRTLRSVGFQPSPPLQIGPQLRDSGVANNPVPRYKGVVLSPQLVQQAMARIIRPGGSVAKQKDVEFLHAAGVVDPYGTTTHPERVAADRAYRRRLIGTLVRKQQAWQHITKEGAPPSEIAAILERQPTAELERLLSWEPSQNQMARAGVSTAGFSLEGLSQLSAGLAAVPRESVPVIGNALGDLVEIPGEAIPSLYYALKPLASGDVGETVNRFADPFVQLAKDPVGSFKEHPLGTALMGTGAVRGVGRTAGFGLRHGTARMRELGSTDRGTATLPNTAFVERRRYSPDAFVKPVQVARDRKASEKARELYVAANEAEREAVRRQQKGGNAEAKFREAKHLREQAFKADPQIITDASKVSLFGKTALERAHDEYEGLAEGLRRLDRTRVIREARKALGKKPSNLIRPVAEGIVAASRQSVEEYLSSVREAAKGLDKTTDRPKLLANEQLQAQLLKALDDPSMDMAPVLAAAERYRKVVGPLQKELRDRKLIDPARADKAELQSYAARFMGAEYEPAHYVRRSTGAKISNSEALRIQRTKANWRDEISHISERVVGPHGRPFTAAEIREHMGAARQAGEPLISDPVYVSQQPNIRSSGAYFKRWLPRVGTRTGLRTTKAVTEGLIDIDPSTLIDQAARTQSLLSADKAFEGWADQFAYRAENGKIYTTGTKGDATALKNTLHAHGSPTEWREVRLNPLGANQEALDALLEATDRNTHLATSQLHRTLQEAFEGKGDGPGPWTLVPAQVADRAASHQKLLGAQQGVKAIQKITDVFRRVVLARPSFVEGNTAEATLRGALKGALPGMPDYWMVRGVRKLMTPAERDRFDQMLGSGHYGFASSSHMHRPVDQLGDGRVAATVKGVAHTKAARGALRAWEAWNHVFFQVFNSTIERQFRMALFGKSFRQSVAPHKPAMRAKTVMAEHGAQINDLARLKSVVRDVDRAYGQYHNFTPEQRRVLMLYTPFGAWMLNSLRFAFQVLPMDHPVITAMLAAATQTSQEWREAHGLTQQNVLETDRLPGFLQGTIPGEGDSHLRGPTRYTPFGFWADPLNALGSSVLPQFSGIEAAFKGTDWKGKPLEDQSILGRGEEALKEFLGAVIPFAGQGEQIFGGDGTLGERARKFVDPFMYTQSAPSKKRRRRSGGGSVDPVDQITQGLGGGGSADAVDQIVQALGG